MSARPDHAAQLRAPVLDVWASLNGYVVGFVGGAYRETIAECPTWDEAFALFDAGRTGLVALGKVEA